MQLDLVHAVRKKGAPPLNAELSPGVYSWLTPHQESADGWARILGGLQSPLRGEMRLLTQEATINPYRNPEVRGQIGLVLLKESGELLGEHVRDHLEAIAQLRNDPRLVDRVRLDKEFLERRGNTLFEHEIRLLHLEIAFATRDLKMLIIVEPQLYPCETWAPRVAEFKQQGAFVHLITISPDRAQLLSPHVVYVEMAPPRAQSETSTLLLVVNNAELTTEVMKKAGFDIQPHHLLLNALVLRGLDSDALLLVQKILSTEEVGIVEWQLLKS